MWVYGRSINIFSRNFNDKKPLALKGGNSLRFVRSGSACRAWTLRYQSLSEPPDRAFRSTYFLRI